MLAHLVLAVTVSPSPTALPGPLVALKTIASVRSTPFCSDLRQHVAPAIAGILTADEAIDASPAHLMQLARDSGIFHDYPHSTFDIMHLESLITPLVRSTKQTQTHLDALHDRQAEQIRTQLQSVLKEQKDALNIISGLVGTFQLDEMTNDSLAGPTNEWLQAIQGPDVRRRDASLKTVPDSIGVDLGHNAYVPFIETMQMTRANIAADERDASQTIVAAAAECGAPAGAPSKP